MTQDQIKKYELLVHIFYHILFVIIIYIYVFINKIFLFFDFLMIIIYTLSLFRYYYLVFNLKNQYIYKNIALIPLVFWIINPILTLVIMNFHTKNYGEVQNGVVEAVENSQNSKKIIYNYKVDSIIHSGYFISQNEKESKYEIGDSIMVQYSKVFDFYSVPVPPLAPVERDR